MVEVLGACLVLSIGANIYLIRFWSSQNQKLVDKLMSRNYAEYAYHQKPPEKQLTQEPVVQDDEVLEELNRFLPS